MRLRQRMQRPRARSRRCVVEQIADQRPQIFLGCARLRLLGRLIPDGRSISMNKWILAALVTVAALHDARPVSAQAPTREGYSLPMMYDSLGAQHFYANGYGGAVLPPMVPRNSVSPVLQGRLRPLEARA